MILCDLGFEHLCDLMWLRTLRVKKPFTFDTSTTLNPSTKTPDILKSKTYVWVFKKTYALYHLTILADVFFNTFFNINRDNMIFCIVWFHRNILSHIDCLWFVFQLTYDYKFDFEDDNHKIPCMCGATFCRKWMNWRADKLRTLSACDLMGKKCDIVR